MPVKGVVAGVEGAAAEPPVERRVRVVEDARRRGDPVDRCRGLPQKASGSARLAAYVLA